MDMFWMLPRNISIIYNYQLLYETLNKHVCLCSAYRKIRVFLAGYLQIFPAVNFQCMSLLTHLTCVCVCMWIHWADVQIASVSQHNLWNNWGLEGIQHCTFITAWLFMSWFISDKYINHINLLLTAFAFDGYFAMLRLWKNCDKHIYSVCVHESDSSKPWWRHKCWRCPNVSDLEVKCDAQCGANVIQDEASLMQQNEVNLDVRGEKSIRFDIKAAPVLTASQTTASALWFLPLERGCLGSHLLSSPLIFTPTQLEANMFKTLNCPYVICKCSVFIFLHFFPLHLLFNIPAFLPPSKPLSVVVYPPAACPLLAKPLISRTLSILHKSSHSYTSYPHLL